ncbi:hypothetical protein B0H14DRAFT_3675411 [Mycena olivaceomarginata]|nr:hypothetical protein B0H14DRAFT_3675411 [Mycena olivaceomarginata]
MLRLLDSLFPVFSRLNSLLSPRGIVPVPAPVLPNQDESWYVNVWGVISHDRRQLYKDRVSTCETSAQHPIYWAPTFEDAVQYLPCCRGFETAFGFGTEDPELFFVIDWDPHVYYDSYAAENAWRRQGVQTNAMFVTLSWNDAWARAQGWPLNYNEYLLAD